MTSQTQTREQLRALREEVGKLEQNVLSIRTEIQDLNLESSRRTDRAEEESTETVLETFDTDKPTDPSTGTPPLKSRTTEKRGNRTTTIIDEASQLSTRYHADSQDSLSTVMDDKVSESLESVVESDENFREETSPKKKSLPWWKKTLMYCGIGTLLYLIIRIVLYLYKPYLMGIISKIKQLLKPY